MKNLFKEIARELTQTVENSCGGIIRHLDSFQNEFKFLYKKCIIETPFKFIVPQPIKVEVQIQVSPDEIKEIRPIEPMEPYQQLDELSKILDQVQAIDEQIFKDILVMLKKQNNPDLLGYLRKQENLKDMNEEMRRKIQKVTNVLRNLEEHDFNKQDYSLEGQEAVRRDIIGKIQKDDNLKDFLKFYLLVQMKGDLRNQSWENIKIKDTSLIGGKFVKCNLNESEFENVDLSGVNLNGALLFNCNWKNIRIHELNRLDGRTSYVYSVCFSPDGTTLASGSDNSIRLWDVKTGQQKAKLDGHSNGSIQKLKQVFLFLLSVQTKKAFDVLQYQVSYYQQLSISEPLNKRKMQYIIYKFNYNNYNNNYYNINQKLVYYIYNVHILKFKICPELHELHYKFSQVFFNKLKQFKMKHLIKYFQYIQQQNLIDIMHMQYQIKKYILKYNFNIKSFENSELQSEYPLHLIQIEYLDKLNFLNKQGTSLGDLVYGLLESKYHFSSANNT